MDKILNFFREIINKPKQLLSAGLSLIIIVVLWINRHKIAAMLTRTDKQKRDSILQNIPEQDRAATANMALRLAQALGTWTGYNIWYNPKAWFEDDEEVLEIFKDIISKKLDGNAIADCYTKLYTAGRSLDADIDDLVDSDILQKIRAIRGYRIANQRVIKKLEVEPQTKLQSKALQIAEL